MVYVPGTATTDPKKQNRSLQVLNKALSELPSSSDVATNTANIATNTADIATNTSNIATNTSGIATNTANIATNTTNIGTNTAGIATLAALVPAHTASNVLSADVLLNNITTFFDGPSMAQGTSGTWFVIGHVSLQDTAAANIACKLWDGTTVISSGYTTIANSSDRMVVTLSGFLASPAANIRISCKDTSNTTGKILFNGSGASMDSAIFGIRIA